MIYSRRRLTPGDRPHRPRIIIRIINMINDEELTGELRGDFTELRILQNGEFVDILSLLATGASGVNDIVSGGGLAVSINNGVATITNTAQGVMGERGSQGPKGDKGDKGDTGLKGDNGGFCHRF